MRRRHKRIVAVSRVSILLTFLFLWEFSANTGLIDSFIFSSPSRIALCFLEMTGDGSIFRHIGVTLYETLVSFILVIFFSLFVTVLLWLFRKLSEILEPYLVVLNSLPNLRLLRFSLSGSAQTAQQLSLPECLLQSSGAY